MDLFDGKGLEYDHIQRTWILSKLSGGKDNDNDGCLFLLIGPVLFALLFLFSNVNYLARYGFPTSRLYGVVGTHGVMDPPVSRDQMDQDKERKVKYDVLFDAPVVWGWVFGVSISLILLAGFTGLGITRGIFIIAAVFLLAAILQMLYGPKATDVVCFVLSGSLLLFGPWSAKRLCEYLSLTFDWEYSDGWSWFSGFIFGHGVGVTPVRSPRHAAF